MRWFCLLSAFALAGGRAAAQPAQICLDDPPAPECESQAFTAQVTMVSDSGALIGLLAIGETLSGTITLTSAAEDIDLSKANRNDPNGLACATVRFPNGRAMTIRLDPQEPCPPERVTDDSIPGPPGDLAALPGALLEFQFQSLLQPSTGVVFSDLRTLEATDPVRCPEPGMTAGLLAGLFGIGLSAAAESASSSRRRRGRRGCSRA